MQIFIKDLGRSIEILLFLIVGFFLTTNLAATIYGSYGIVFTGNVWVNWFGISFFLFVVYAMIMGALFKEVKYYKAFLQSKIFWLAFVVSIYIIFVPFVKGENPF
ncbi:hypothetical protein [Halalkalibacter krulwichiae]|uniref:Uncharacterized protein n=1 Tax=Halalkalibacter krulwichiae TaxID=199441 RepID=A0A1X9MFY0_9BACI|nr:hypothetical protein [Halalkalibacter krulwichiae]ARK32365.1 hypothetical protein BkAM31D_22285 [Halalkalibacter krulwichiae]